MSSHESIPRSGFERDSMPLDAARSAFEWLVAGPHPVSVDGRLFPGLPARRVPLNELRDRLLRRRCPQTLRDSAWAHLVLLACTEGGAWTVGAVGVALPALTSIAATLSARFAGDPSDIHAAVLAGFVAELGEIDLRRPRVMLRLRWAAYRAGHTAVREALDAPVPSGHGFRPTIPPPPWGHPDFVLARAVADGAITSTEAELIGSTRLEGVPLADAAAERNLSYQAAKKARQRAEHRLVAYLLDNTADTPRSGPREGDVATQVADAVTITAAAQHSTTTLSLSRTVTDLATRTTKKVGDRVSPQDRFSGVQGCGRKPATPAHTTSSPTPSRESTQHSPQRPSGTTPGVSRCA
ncbi:hypothetical protein SAMN05216188_11596 [Lentzea xinjiangensis]|uniref:Uncharacterized protein n=1 Tax=Lentzea xinjiangensis TaxID=402600 RepID=A0A1H9RW16_9PSEU|nr:PqqD family protein [Lentzea xinjiangensis]SER76992.1 hypothetical protein SAMN05216188_11596 [Lentzea xinjiangensis]